MPRNKTSREEAEKRIFQTHGDKIEILEYSHSHGYSLFHCNVCNNEWNALTYSVWGGNGCPKCKLDKLSKRFAFSIDYVKDYIESRGCILNSTEYKNDSQKLNITFECGHTGNMSFECFQRGQRCAICGRKRCNLLLRLPEEELNKRLSEKKLTIIEFPDGYVNRNSLVTCKCELGHIETRPLATVLVSSGCTACTLIRASINQSGEKGSNWQGGKSSLTSFLSKSIKQWKKDSIANSNYCCVLCGEGHRFNDVHHLYNFYNIVTDALDMLGLNRRKSVGEYTEEELSIITDKILELHYSYPYGVALCRYHHKDFHHYYGIHNNTPEQFYEYRDRIMFGDLASPQLN